MLFYSNLVLNNFKATTSSTKAMRHMMPIFFTTYCTSTPCINIFRAASIYHRAGKAAEAFCIGTGILSMGNTMPEI